MTKSFKPAKGVRTSELCPSSYFDEPTFKRELDQIFVSNWLFVGLTDQLQERNSFITMQVGPYPILVQNFKSGLSAFLNICSHRKAKLQQQEQGKRPLICPYHGWSFGSDGCPLKIPDNDASFMTTEESRQKLALERLQVETCGRFVFVRISQQGPSLSDFLLEYREILEHISDVMGPIYKSEQLNWATNWKIGVESVMEVYHVKPVHKDSFSSMTREGWDCSYAGKHNIGTSYLSPKSTKWWGSIKSKLAMQASELYSDYDHFFIYPNLAIGITSGASISIQTYLPDRPESCRLHYRLAIAKNALNSKRSAALSRAVTNSLASFNTQVLEEDRVISEDVQKGFMVTKKKPVYGNCEGRIQHFHHSLLEDLSDP